MSVLTYNLSPTLQTKLNQAKELRRKILLSPIPPSFELQLKWEAALNRIYWSLILADIKCDKKELTHLLSLPQKKKLDANQQRAVDFKKAMDHIYQDWLASPALVSPKALLKLYDIGCRDGRSGKPLGVQEQKELKFILEYLQAGSDNPIIQAGTLQIQIIEDVPFKYANNRMSRLASYLLLYKNGYDFRQLLVLEEFFRSDLVALKQAIESVRKYKNLTGWLEYFATGVVYQLQKALNDINETNLKTDLPNTFWQLNVRQRAILSLTDKPEERITNRRVQQFFKVSQITASRDLSKMASLGLLFAHGKGRSVYYTRV